MIRPGRAVHGGLHRLPIAFDLKAVSVEEGVRAGLSVAVLVAADYIFHAPLLLEAGLGALLTCLCDSGGSIRQRAPPLIGFALVGGLLIALLGLARPVGYPLIPIACAGVFVFSLMRIYSRAAQQVGTLLTVVLVLALDHPLHSLHRAALLSGAFVGGSVWALLLTMVIWRLHPNRPSRQAVARVYLALAALCDDMREMLHDTAAPAQAWERHARAHRRTVRDAIEQARDIVSQRLRAGGTASRPVTRTLLRLEAADQIFHALIALSDRLETDAAPATRPPAILLAKRLGRILRALAPFIVEDRPRSLAPLETAITSIAALATGAATPVSRIADIIAERLRAALTLTAEAGAIAPLARPRPMDRLLSPLRANLDWNSAALRHAARAALVAAAGFAITFTWPTSYQHWLTITMVLTLQPYYALTLQRALERIGGTVLGGLLAAVISIFCHTPLTIAAALLPLSVITLSVRAVNFGLYITALTPMIVLLVELGAPAHGQFTVVLMRALYTLIGGGLAVLGCIFLWPSWEPDRLDRELRTAIRLHGHYASRELLLLQDLAPAPEVDLARRAAGMASNNLEASLSRALLEPGSGKDRLNAALVIDAALRRMAGRLTAMHIDPIDHDQAELATWTDWITQAAQLLATKPAVSLPPRPTATGPLADSLTRIARQLDLAAGALRRYDAG